MATLSSLNAFFRSMNRSVFQALLLLSCVPFCCTFRNMTDHSRLLIGTVMSLSSSTRPDGSVLDADSSGLLQGYRFWIEKTNEEGGLFVNGRSVPIELQFYNDESDPNKVEELYQQLVDDGVDVLFGGLPATSEAMARVSTRNGVVAISPFSDLGHDSIAHRSVFWIVGGSAMRADAFLQAGSSNHDVKSIALLQAQNSSRAELICKGAKTTAEDLGMDLVFDGSYNHENSRALESALAGVVSAKPDALLVCSSGPDATAVVQAAVSSFALQGTDIPGGSVSPGWVDSPFLRFLFLADAPPHKALAADLGGFAHGILRPQSWHHDLNFSDPFFGSTAALDAEWIQRHDYGRGEHLTVSAASAVAVGVALRIAVERGGGATAAALQDALRSMDSETFYGRIRMGGGQSNRGLAGVTTQVSCLGGDDCRDRMVLPVPPRGAAGMAPLPRSCGRGALREAAVQEGEVKGECPACMEADAEAVSRVLEGGGPAREVLRAACEVLGSTVRVGVGAGPAGVREAVAAGLAWAKRRRSALWNVEIETEEVGAEGAEGVDAVVWSRDRAAEAGGGGIAVQVAVGVEGVRETVEMVAAGELQGKAIAFFLRELGLTSCHVVACRAMAREFKRDAAAYGMEVKDAEVEGRAVVAAGEATAEWAEEQLRLDACTGTVLVMCVDQELAEALTKHMRAHPDLRRIAVLGPEALTRVAEPLPGSIAVRLSAESAAWDNRSAAEWAGVLSELEAVEWSAGHRAWMEAQGPWGAVPQAVLQGFDAGVWLGKLLAARINSDGTWRPNETLAEDMRWTEHLGLTGLVLFREDLARSSGRLGLLVRQEREWEQAAIWDMQDAAGLKFDTGKYATQEHWLAGAVAGQEEGLVLPQCPCEVWHRMPPGSSILECKWSASAVSVTVAGGVVLVLLCVCLLAKVCRRRFEDKETRMVYKRMQELRKFLGLQKRRGYMLSSEQENKFSRTASSSALYHYRMSYSIIPRKHLEALAKMTLMLPFEISMMDQFSLWLRSLDRNGRQSLEGTTGATRVSFTSDRDDEAECNWRYLALCDLVILTSATLLSPDEDEEEEEDEDRADVSRPCTPHLTSRQSFAGWQNEPKTQDERFKFFKEHVGQLRIWGFRGGALFQKLKDQVVQSYLDDINAKLNLRYTTMIQEDGGRELVAFEWDETENAWWLQADAETKFRCQVAEKTAEEDGSDGSMRSAESGGSGGEGQHARSRAPPPASAGVFRRHLLPSMSKKGLRRKKRTSKVEEAEDQEEEEEIVVEAAGEAATRAHALSLQAASFKELIETLSCDEVVESEGLNLRDLHITRTNSGSSSTGMAAQSARSLQSVGRLASLTPGNSKANVFGSPTHSLGSPVAAEADSIAKVGSGKAGSGSASTPTSWRGGRSSPLGFGGDERAKGGSPRPCSWGHSHVAAVEVGHWFGEHDEPQGAAAEQQEAGEAAAEGVKAENSPKQLPPAEAPPNLEPGHVSSRWDRGLGAKMAGRSESGKRGRWSTRLKTIAGLRDPEEVAGVEVRRGSLPTIGRRFGNRKGSMVSNQSSQPSPSGSTGPQLVNLASLRPAGRAAYRRFSTDIAEVLHRKSSRQIPASPTDSEGLQAIFSRKGSQQSDSGRSARTASKQLKRSRSEEGAGAPDRGWLRKLTSMRKPWRKEPEEASPPPPPKQEGSCQSSVADMEQLANLRNVSGLGAGVDDVELSGVSSLPVSLHQDRPLFVKAANDEPQTPHSDRGSGRALRQDHRLVRAIRVDEQDQAEAEIQWEVEEVQVSAAAAGKGVSPRRVVDEDVFISQLHRRAELLNDGFLQQIKMIVEAHRPMDMASSAAMGRIKTMAWLENNDPNEGSQTKPPSNCTAELASPRSNSTLNATAVAGALNTSFSKRHGAGAALASGVCSSSSLPSTHVGSNPTVTRPLEVSESLVPGPGSASTPRNARAALPDLLPPTVSTASSGSVGGGALSWAGAAAMTLSGRLRPRVLTSTGVMEVGEEASLWSSQPRTVSNATMERNRLLSEQTESPADGPPSMSRSISSPVEIRDLSERPYANGAGGDARPQTLGLVKQLNSGFQRLRRQSSLLVSGLTGTSSPATPPRREARRPPRLTYSELVEQKASMLQHEQEQYEHDAQRSATRSTPPPAPHPYRHSQSARALVAGVEDAAPGGGGAGSKGGAAHRVSSDPHARAHSKKQLRGWTSLGRLQERAREEDGQSSVELASNGEGATSFQGGNSFQVKLMELASNLSSEERAWGKKNWRALKEIVPRRTRAALRRLSSIQQGGTLLADLVRKEEWKFRVIPAPVKTKERMREKLMEYVKRGERVRPLTANILDPIRATVVCDGPMQILNAVGWFLNNNDPKLPAMPIVRVKNKFSLKDASEYDGYRDLMVCVIHTGRKGLRIIGEIQFHDAKLHALKLKMHKLYKVKRAEGANLI